MKMNKIELLYGFVIGILASVFGIYIFVACFTDYNFLLGIEIMKSQGKLGKLITLGSILDLIAFAVLLRLNKELMARGVVLAVIVIAFVTLLA